MPNLPCDWLDELLNIGIPQRLRWADSLKNAGEYSLAETVFPDTPELDLAAVALRESNDREAA